MSGAEEGKKNMDFCLDELVKVLLDAIADGYHYGSLDVIEPDDECGVATVCLETADCGGDLRFGLEFVDGVPCSEVEKYAFNRASPAPLRHSFSVSRHEAKYILRQRKA